MQLPVMPFAFTVYNRDPDKPGGAFPPTREEHAAAPQLEHAEFTAASATLPPDKSPDWISKFLAVYRPLLQFMTGQCVHETVAYLCHGTALNIQGVAIEPLSVGFSYYTTTGDPTFSRGSTIHFALTQGQNIGICADSLYSQEFVISHWQGGGAYPAEYLPQPSCYPDALRRKIVQWSALPFGPPDINQIKLLLNAGYFISFYIGNHQMTLAMYDGWWFFGFDSEATGDVTGRGVGVRAFSEDLIRQAQGMCIVQQVDMPAGAAPVVDPVTLAITKLQNARDLIGTAMPDIPAAVTAINAALAALTGATPPVAPPVTPPPATPPATPPVTPPAGVVSMPPALSLVDSKGLVWTQGDFISTRYGWQLRCNGRSLASSPEVALVGGQIKMRIEAGKAAWQVFTGSDQWNNTWAATTAPV